MLKHDASAEGRLRLKPLMIVLLVMLESLRGGIFVEGLLERWVGHFTPLILSERNQSFFLFIGDSGYSIRKK